MFARLSPWGGTSPLPHPTSHTVSSMGGRVGERAGAASPAQLEAKA